MQQDAVARVREMQQRARQTVDEHGADMATDPSRNGGWPASAAGQHSSRRRAPQSPNPNLRYGDPAQSEPDPPAQPAPPPPQPAREPGKDTTVLQDILGAIGLSDDRLLILGLILILINDKADTTLILALCYLLF